MLKNQAVAVKNTREIGILTRAIGTVLTAFLLANSTIGGGQSPIVVGFVAALNLPEGIFAFLGALAAYFFTGKVSSSIIEICAMLIILVMKVLICEVFGKEMKVTGSTILSGMAFTLCGLAITFVTTTSGATAFVVTCKGILCGCATYFLITAFSAIQREHKLVVTGTLGASLGVVFVLLVASLCSVQLGFFNLGRALGITIVLLAAKKYKHIGGAVCGALVTCGVVLYSSEMGKATMLLAVAGLIAGLFAEFGVLAAAFFFISANAVGLIVIGVTPETSRILVDVLFASVAFVIVPDRLVTNVLGVGAVTKVSDKVTALAASKLNFAAKTIGEVRKSVEQVSKALEKRNCDNDISVAVCDNICGKCKNNINCWESEFDKSFESFNQVRKSMDIKGKITMEDLPQGLNKCYKKAELVESFNEIYNDEQSEKKANQKLKEMRGILYEQFSGMEDMLEEIGREIINGKECDDELSKSVKNFLIDFGAESPRACVFFNSFGKISIEAFYDGNLNLTDIEIADEISDIVDRELELPQIFIANGYTKLCLMEKPAYVLEIGVSQKSGKNGETSGDTFEHFDDGRGNAYIIISDGMGSGKIAAIDSLMTSSLLVRLLKAGIGFSAAVKLINSSMLVKSNNESFATLDIACINLYTGRLDLLKLGAAATFLKTNDRITCVEASSLPIGILRDIQPEMRSTVLKDGDSIVMISDGVSEKAYPAVKEEMLNHTENSSDDISKILVEKSYKQFENEKADDITIIVAKILKL